MAIFLVTFGFFLLIVVAMAVGYIFQQKSLAGSCGGLGTLGIDKACDCDDPCEKRQEKERKAAIKAEHKIDIKNI
ncbi:MULTISPECIES: (Na+)-NQR maturation NqrM [Thalassotalea]|uniref:(Na+)-NQR maturation NqrM n=1 Tax=Thalassotalea TaxID=1518149 RepID=UPI000944BDC2|nr:MULTISPECIES: (Na+)-NQR maturation NqrM [Thalassotalea]MDO6428652.1 (Na+)-NQR maturation NqrM [Thalassotalea sp. 1_MG-2023]OKY26933.1 Na(+)-translocating NADH-quinone reductase subunit E [Thalassotalea sp. PP2-459]